MSDCERIWAEIDLDAIRFNIESIKKKTAGGAKIIAVIKADGYGHGAVPVARILEEESGVWGYAVATVQEALELRESGMKKPILILGYTFACDYGELIENEIRPTVFTYETAMELSDAAKKAGKPCHIHIKIDTGMGRIGMAPCASSIDEIAKIAGLDGIKIEGIFTHLARADEKDRTRAIAQIDKFRGFINDVEAVGVHIPMKHCSNSAGIVRFPEAHMDAVRAGIILYGLWPSMELLREAQIELAPVLSLKSRVIYVKTMPAGCDISFGGTFTTANETRVASVCSVYGDGYPRSLSNKGSVLINGQRAPILGRVCMDQLMVDVTGIGGEIREGSIVTLIGRDGNDEITAQELGELSGRFNYELVCDMGKRIPRVYKNQ